ncbi:helix-turn-helix domain-containing protein [Actinomadura fibrosa]|uniref:Helix-turn-helix domain-containing protein n=1 Tax=Actinomadura fibrosa TaxID=111802 RepID=A0ABW2XN62_9ACTN|nr:helix-turn-helix domain-containing protein [Actinomadura fibrosa]
MTATPVKPCTARRRFARVRRAAGFTQDRLAAHLGVERSTVGRWELGDTEPQPHVRPRLAEALNLSSDELDALLADTADERPSWAVRLQAEREARGWSKREMARRLFAAIGVTNGLVHSQVRQISGWEAGVHFPRDWHAAYAIAFGMDQLELFGPFDFQTGRRLVTLDPLSEEEEEDMERRELLQHLTALGIAVIPATKALDSICASVGRTFEDGERQRLDHWDEVTAEYGHSYMASPPEQNVRELAADLVALRLITRELDRDTLHYKEWCRIGSTLSGLMAKALSGLGHTREARHWWQTAQAASDSSGYLDARLWVRGERLIHGLYERRSPHLLLRQATDAMHLADGLNCAGLLHISASRAQTLASLGIHDAAATELARTARIYDGLPSTATDDVSSVFAMTPNRVHYTEAWIHAHAGDIDKTDRAAERALPYYPATHLRTPTQVKLMQAYARTRAGDVTEGIRQAHTTYEVLPPEHRSTMVTDLANRVLEPIPAAQRKHSAVSDYRELVALPSAGDRSASLA